MIDRVQARAEQLMARKLAAEAQRERDATEMAHHLTSIATRIDECAREMTSFAVEIQCDFDEYDPQLGWVSVGAPVSRLCGAPDRSICTVEVRLYEATVEYVLQGKDGAYLEGGPFERANGRTIDDVANLASEVIVETLAHWLAGGVKLSVRGPD
jgi:hypothetical protein